MDSNKEIKVYGTFVNWTINDLIKDNTHNDAVAYAKQLYDDRFGASPNAANFQDVINKRLTAISYANGITTIDSPFVVNGTSNLNGNSTISNLTVTGPTNLQDTLTVAGKTTVNNKIESTQDITAKGLTINGNAAVNGELSVSVLHPTNGLVVNGTTVLNDGVTVKGGATIADTGLTVSNGNVRIATGNLSVDQGEVGGKTLDIETTGAIHGNLTVGGTITSTGNISAPNTNDAITTVNRLDAAQNVTGSVKQQIKTACDDLYQKIIVGVDPQTLDSLNDVIAWIIEHQDDAAAMLEDIQNLKTGKQDKLTFDNIPQEGSSNPVKSGGIYSQIQAVNAAINSLGNTYYTKTAADSKFATNTSLTAALEKISTLETKVAALEGLWELSDGKVSSKGRAVLGAGFYDSTVS